MVKTDFGDKALRLIIIVLPYLGPRLLLDALR